MPPPLAQAFLAFNAAVDAFEANLDEMASDPALRRFVHSSRGMAVAPFLVTTALSDGDTRYCLYYRCHAWLLALGGEPDAIINEVMANAPLSPMQPRLPTLPVDFISVTVGAQLPIAVGLALAGTSVVAVLGDGAMSTGVVYESLNIAALHRPDILFVLDDNDRAVSTSGSWVTQAEIPGLCDSLNLDYHHVVASETESFDEAVAWITAGKGTPRLLHVTSSPSDQHSLAAAPIRAAQ